MAPPAGYRPRENPYGIPWQDTNKKHETQIGKETSCWDMHPRFHNRKPHMVSTATFASVGTVAAVLLARQKHLLLGLPYVTQ
jgi:hypothetical protein